MGVTSPTPPQPQGRIEGARVADRALRPLPPPEPAPHLVPRGILGAFAAAAWGLLGTVATQRHMKVHVTSAVMVMIVGMALPLNLASRTALLFAVALVFFAEILNTALEAFVDLHIRDFAEAAMVAKDAAAAGVLVLALATVAVLADILWVQWDVVVASSAAVERSLAFGLPLTAVAIALLFGPAKAWLRAGLGVAAVGLALPLWAHSGDPVFSVLLGVLLALAVLARERPFSPPPLSSTPGG